MGDANKGPDYHYFRLLDISVGSCRVPRAPTKEHEGNVERAGLTLTTHVPVSIPAHLWATWFVEHKRSIATHAQEIDA
jgi:hypothetical protein